MKIQEIPLWSDPGITSHLTVCSFSAKDRKRPAILVVPGGGYCNVCRSSEGDPVAKRFSELGFRTFILDYRVFPHHYPAPQQDIFRAIRLIRHHAEAWKVIPDQIAVCGFSAGGHLSACSGILADDFLFEQNDEADSQSSKPDAMLLCYPVITSGRYAHDGSFHSLLQEEYNDRKEEFSLEKRVNSSTPPAFIWHTMEDPVVPVENSILLSEAMRKNKVKHELHLYPSGPHGMQLGYGRSDISQWPEQAAAFLYGTCGFRREIPDAEKRTVALVFDCPGKSLIKTVVPVLQKYGFCATFFTSDHPEKGHLSVADLKKLSDSGFEIGAEFSAADESFGMEQKIVKLKTFFEKQALPAPVSFAYPGGKYDPNVCRILKKHGFRLAAETTEESRVFDLLTGNSFRIPGCLMHYNSELLFYFAAGETGIHKLPVLLFHDIPEKRSDESLCSPEFFAARMKYLYDNGYRAVSLKDAVGK